MGIEEGFGILQDITLNITVFNISWIIAIVFLVITLLIITRDFNKWKILILPVTVLWHIVGITPSFLQYVIGSIFFIIELISVEMIGNLIEGVTGTLKGDKDAFKEALEKERLRRFKEGLKKKSTNKDYLHTIENKKMAKHILKTLRKNR